MHVNTWAEPFPVGVYNVASNVVAPMLIHELIKAAVAAVGGV